MNTADTVAGGDPADPTAPGALLRDQTTGIKNSIKEVPYDFIDDTGSLFHKQAVRALRGID